MHLRDEFLKMRLKCVFLMQLKMHLKCVFKTHLKNAF
jgi:hypothetical protein